MTNANAKLVSLCDFRGCLADGGIECDTVIGGPSGKNDIDRANQIANNGSLDTNA